MGAAYLIIYLEVPDYFSEMQGFLLYRRSIFKFFKKNFNVNKVIEMRLSPY